MKYGKINWLNKNKIIPNLVFKQYARYFWNLATLDSAMQGLLYPSFFWVGGGQLDSLKKNHQKNYVEYLSPLLLSEPSTNNKQ